MMRIALTALVTVSLLGLGACSGSSKSSSYSVTPKVQVTVKGTKKKSSSVNYRRSPQDSKPTGSAGSAK